MTDTPEQAKQSQVPWSPMSAGEVWRALVTEPGTGVSIVDDKGNILFCNDMVAQMFLGQDADGVAGKHIRDVLPGPVVDEHKRQMREVAQRKRPVLVRDLWGGVQLLATVYHIEQPEDEPDHYLSIIRHVVGETDEVADDASETMISNLIDLGPLDVLTTRELEVLSLIGQGLITKEIANVLSCSPRTVEVHRQSIGKKLQVTDRVRLARIAIEAGLVLQDAKRERVSNVEPS